MPKFPKDNAAALKAFYGDPAAGEVAPQLVTVKPPFHLWYGNKKVTQLSFHKKAAPALEQVFNKIWDYYGRDQKLLDKLEISFYSGAYNHRLVRGSKTKWSNHAFGAAYDMDAEDNALGAGRGDIPYPVIAAFKSEGFSWGGDYKGRTDPMHFEACYRGDPEWTFEQWLKHYNCPPTGAPKKEVKQAPVVKVQPKPVSVPAPAPAPKPAVKPAPAPADRFDMGGREAVQPAPAPAPVTAPSTPVIVQHQPIQPGVYSIEVEIVQRMLDRIGYHNVGEIDGRFGGATRGAIAAFMNDRGIEGDAAVSPQVKSELEKAIVEGWRRPISEERATATARELETKLPEVSAAATAERSGFWASIVTGAAAVFTGIVKSAGEAVELLTPVRNFVSDVPWQFWVLGALSLSIALYYISRKSAEAKNEAAKAYNEGART